MPALEGVNLRGKEESQSLPVDGHPEARWHTLRTQAHTAHTHGTPGPRSRMEVSAAGSQRPSLWFVAAESKAAPK